MAKKLNIGSLKLPAQAATKGLAFIGKRGSGKSYGAGVFAEELAAANIPFVVIDPIDVWWGLRVAADGKGKGLPVVVFGREHADIQLTRNMGREIARAVVHDNVSCVISTFGMGKAEMREIVTDFSEELLRLNNTPRQVIIEEAHEYVPQRVMGATARCFAAVEALIVMGRNRGLGVTLLNQRMATINKDVVSQIDTLVAFRSVGPQDRKALRDWVEAHGDEEHFSEFMSSVPSLPTGEAWVWSPEFMGIFERAKFRKRETFHPDREKLGTTFKMPDIKATDVQAFIEKFNKKPEPKIPKKDLDKVHVARISGEAKVSYTDVQRITDAHKKGFEAGKKAADAFWKKEIEKERASWRRLLAHLDKRIYDASGILNAGVSKRPDIYLAGGAEKVAESKVERAAGARVTPPEGLRSSAAPSGARVEGQLSRGARSVLTYLSRVAPSGKSKAQLWIAARYSPGGGFDHIVSELTSAGLVERSSMNKYFAVTPVDESLLDPDFDSSVGNWMQKLSRGGQKVFKLLLDNPSNEYSKQEIADITGYAMGGGFDHIISELTSKSLAVRDGRAYKINQEVLDI